MHLQSHTRTHADSNWRFTAYFWLAGPVLLCLIWLTPQFSHAFEAPTPALDSEIYRIQDLSETQVAEAIKQLSALKKNSATTASLADQRLTLSALIGLYLSDDQREPARLLIAELDQLGQHNKDVVSNALVFNFRATILRDEGRLEDAKNANEQALQLAKSVNDKQLTRRVNNTAAVITGDMGDFNAALQYQLASMLTLDSNNRHDDIARINGLNNIGTVYLDLKNPKMALDYFEKGIKLATSIDAQNKLAMLTLNRGVAFSMEENYPDSIVAYLEAEKIAKKISDRRNETMALNNLSDSYYRQGNYQQCLHYGKQTLALAEQLANDDMQAQAMINVGLCHMGLGAVALGAKEVEQGIERLRKENARPEIEPVFGQLAAAYEKAGMYREAFKAIGEQLRLSGELFKSDQDRAVAEMKAKYDASEREIQIEVLEQKNQRQSAEINNKGLQRIIAIIATMVAVVIALTILFLYRKVRQTNKNLEEANVKLAHQSTRDPLTGLLNRRAFHDAMTFRTLTSEQRAIDNGNPPHALVMLDIDHFKRINDTFGHASGDAVLIELSKRLSHVMRDKDMLMRWGGEEFLIFLNHIAIEKLPHVVERILISAGGRAVEFDHNVIPATISVGYISLPMGGESEVDANWEKMLNLADSALYMAKTRGRNQAIGIKVVGVEKENLDELLEGNLEISITQGRVTIEQIAGPAQNEATTQY